MSTPQGITEKLYAQADKELQQRISKALDQAKHFFRDGVQRYVQMADGAQPPNTVRVHLWSLFDKLEAEALEIHREANREAKVNEFMSKVESLGEQVEELRGSIQ